MKTIKFYPSNRSVIKLDGKKVKGYTIDSIPEECNSWFNNTTRNSKADKQWG
jgi:hypothetical protein